MVLDHTQATVGYRCPACGTGVISIVGIFKLSGDLIRLKCPCGGSELQLCYTKDRKIRLTVPCLVCPRPHVAVLSQNTFFENKLFTLPCSLSGLDICFIGDKDQVCAAMDRAEEELLNVLRQAGLEPGDSLQNVAAQQTDAEQNLNQEQTDFSPELNFPDNHIHDLVHFVVRDLEAEGKIYCGCAAGQGSYLLIPQGDHVTVHCEKCGRERQIPCNNSLFANAFLEYDSLTLE